MFGLFKKKERELPPFNELKNSGIKDVYFVRLARWDWLNQDMIHVVDNNAPRMITMDPWPQLIYLEADGQKTVSEFVYDMASKYGKKQPIPEELDSTIIQMINSLINDKLIELSTESRKLPYYIDLPQSKQDLNKANKLMIEDGFIKE
ncbi:hypothetical protein H9Q13_08335 [Pontibacter sp. JH31]|uniref:Coenzyme PQQ synthesis protein D (PqqD) n=1 Tax=Pontibacter aquaedesilientis TaxID=2766980 RepID=A0ABR7XHQ3_9BACT|nr:hypothetical protein [Pontibacter aquaedesilientis]MBD1397168.1 hypothetical protein [Pontibacter aquaedesilientis]